MKPHIEEDSDADLGETEREKGVEKGGPMRSLCPGLPAVGVKMSVFTSFHT